MQADADEEDNLEHDGDGRWPFHGFVEQLIVDMFDPGEFFVFILLD
jgi:TATA-binding protein-associated factor